MPKINDTVQISLTMRGDTRPFWQTSGTITSVAAGLVAFDGFDRPITTTVSELKPAGANRWNLAWEIRTRP
jgi:hypothetical protein